MELTHEDVAAILDLVERSSVEYLEVELGGTRIVADRTGTTVAARPVTAPAAPAVPPTPEPAAAAAAPPPPADAASPAPTVAEGLVVVTAPVVGVFYRAPDPGAAPFVDVGARVEAGATMGLVEVMKMFNSVTAPATGEVVEVLAANDEFVEFGQPLFRLRPA